MVQGAKKRLNSTAKQNLMMFGGLAFCIVFFSVLTPLFGQSIWSAEKLDTLITDVIVTALLSVGAVFVYALGNIDRGRYRDYQRGNWRASPHLRNHSVRCDHVHPLRAEYDHILHAWKAEHQPLQL